MLISPADPLLADTSYNTSSLILLATLTFEAPGSRAAFCCIYTAAFLLALLGNALLGLLVAMDPELHRPMYVLVAGLSLSDITSAASILPRTVQNAAWAPLVSLGECVAQMAFLHLAIRLQAFTLAIMSVDRCLAIGLPLRYPSLVSCRVAVWAFLAATATAAGLVLVNVVLVSNLDLCRARVIANPTCDFLSICSLACGSVAAHHRYGYATLGLTIVLPASVIAVSYAIILVECRKPGLRDGQRKALRTCGTHLLVVLIYFTSILFTFVNGISIFASVARDVRLVMQTIHTLLPPVLNPVVYGLCSAKIRSRLARLCRHSVAPSRALSAGTR